MKITINASSSYDVVVGKNLLTQELLHYQKKFLAVKAVVITDNNVAPFHLAALKSLLENENILCLSYILPFGEENKTLTSVASILAFLEQNEITNADLIIGFGGGVITDIAGFVANIYKRGVKLINIPTTLIGMVDASIGGKNGVNTKIAKNQIGTFYQPNLVLCDASFLATLPQDELTSGLAEVIKYAMLTNATLLDLLQKNEPLNYDEIVYQSVLSKKLYIEQDEHDTGTRRLLNFGHTLGHAIEMHSHYKISHGYAVAMGMSMVTQASEKATLSNNGTHQTLCSLLKKHQLPTSYDYSIPDLLPYLKSDKKINSDGLNLIVLKAPLCPYIHTIDVNNNSLF